MPVLMILELPGVTAEQYDRVQDILEMHTDAETPDGLISHAAGSTGDGWLVADVWESEEALGRFVEAGLKDALRQAGIDPDAARPRVLPVHNLIAQGAGTKAGVIVLIDVPGFGAEHYDRMIAGMDAHIADGSRHPAVSHAAALGDDGVVVVDVWESPEAFGRFAEEQVAPAGQAIGLPAFEPRFVAVHNRLRGRAGQPAA